MPKYVKTSDRIEYRISSDEGTLEIMLPDIGRWQDCAYAPNGLTLKDLRLTPSGANVECLTSDGYWRERNSCDALVLTALERNRQRKEEKKSDSNKESKKSGGFGFFSKSSKESNSTNSVSSDSSFDDYEFSTSIEEDEYEAPEVPDHLLGGNYQKLNHEEKAIKILSLYKTDKITEEQTIDQLEWIIDESTYDEYSVDDFVEEFSNERSTADPSEWAKRFVSIFKKQIAEQLRIKNIFPELLEEIDKEENVDECIESSTERRNARVKKLKDERNRLGRNIDWGKESLRTELLNLISHLEKLLEYEKELSEIENIKLESNSIISSYKETRKIKEKKKYVKKNIEWVKERILSDNKYIKEKYTELKNDIIAYNKVCNNLYECTSSKIYHKQYSLKCDATDIAETISKNIKQTDSQELLKLLSAYLLESYVFNPMKTQSELSSSQHEIDQLAVNPIENVVGEKGPNQLSQPNSASQPSTTSIIKKESKQPKKSKISFGVAWILMMAALILIGIIANISKSNKTESNTAETTTSLNKTADESDEEVVVCNDEVEENENDSDTNTSEGSSDGLYPFTSERVVTESDLVGLSSKDLKIMRNEIYARHGYIFKTADMKAYFSEQSWYSPISENVELSDLELKNVNFIKAHE